MFKPKKKNCLNKVIFLLSGLLVFSLGSWLYLENLKVGLSHDLKTISSDIRDLKVENAELKNELFAFFIPEKVAEIAALRNLIKESNPIFVYAGN